MPSNGPNDHGQRTISRRTALRFGLAAIPVVASFAIPGVSTAAVAAAAASPRRGAATTLAGTSDPGYLPPFSTRPSGADYVRWEDLVKPSDGVTSRTVGSQVVYSSGSNVFHNVVNRCPAGKIVTFPAGVFEINSAGWSAPGNCAVRWPKQSKGFIGNVPAGKGWGNMAPDSQRTVFRVKANTAPAKNVAGSWFQAGFTGSQQLTMANIHFEGTEQGMQTVVGKSVSPGSGNDGTSHRLFTNVFIYGSTNGSTARDILSTGAFGNTGAPPGETFLFQWYYATAPTLCRVNLDGRRQIGGPSYAAAGLTFGNTLNGIVNDCYFHHCGQAGFTAFQSYGLRTYDLVLGDASDHSTNHVNGKTSGDWMNHERVGDIVHTRLVLNTFSVGRAQVCHLTHSGDAWTLNRDGKNYSTGNGKLKLVDPKWSNILFNNRLAITYWGPKYGSKPSAMQVSNVPQLVTGGGTRVPAKWCFHDTGWRDI